MPLTRREFLQDLAIVAGVVALPKNFRPRLVPASPVDYGFAIETTPAHRHPDPLDKAYDHYQTGSLLRFQKLDIQGWAKIINDEYILKPERPRAHGETYVATSHLRHFDVTNLYKFNPKIDPDQLAVEVILTRPQKMIVYNGSKVILESLISAGLHITSTPGEYHVNRRLITRYMQGDDYDLPGVPVPIYFDEEGRAFHGTYWHHDFGNPHSHGCINVPTDVAIKLCSILRLPADLGDGKFRAGTRVTLRK